MPDYLNRWSDAPDRSLAEAQRLAEQAIEKGPNEPRAHHAAAGLIPAILLSRSLRDSKRGM